VNHPPYNTADFRDPRFVSHLTSDTFAMILAAGAAACTS